VLITTSQSLQSPKYNILFINILSKFVFLFQPGVFIINSSIAFNDITSSNHHISTDGLSSFNHKTSSIKTAFQLSVTGLNSNTDSSHSEFTKINELGCNQILVHQFLSNLVKNFSSIFFKSQAVTFMKK